MLYKRYLVSWTFFLLICFITYKYQYSKYTPLILNITWCLVFQIYVRKLTSTSGWKQPSFEIHANFTNIVLREHSHSLYWFKVLKMESIANEQAVKKNKNPRNRVLLHQVCLIKKAPTNKETISTIPFQMLFSIKLPLFSPMASL